MKCTKKINYPIVMSLMVALGMFIGTKYSPFPKEKTNSANKFSEILNYIESSYVDNINIDSLSELSIEKILLSLDPHSSYIPKSNMEGFVKDFEGNFDGIGIEFNIFKDTLVVVHPIVGGPSELLGIRSGDKIIKIDDKNVAGIGLKNKDVFKYLKGHRGTKVKISISRNHSKKLLDYSVTRDKIPIHSIEAAYMIDKKTGIIKLGNFAKNTKKEFSEKMDQLRQKGLENLILDLRSNGGGILDPAVFIVQKFLRKNKLIVYTEGRRQKRKDYKSFENGDFVDVKLVILIDESSASASEVVSGAIQDLDRGLIVGRRSYGKGLVQNLIRLSDGSMIKLTVSKYYTPSGRCIQKSYKRGNLIDYHLELFQRFKHGEFTDKDSIKFLDSLKYTTANGRIVYGGGGIMPDIFVPLDTNSNSKYVIQLSKKGIIHDFVMNYVDINRSDIKSLYPNFEYFQKEFKLEGDVLKHFFKFAEKQDVKTDIEGFNKSKNIIELQIKSLIARYIWSNNEYYKSISELDRAYQVALKAFEDGSFEKHKIK